MMLLSKFIQSEGLSKIAPLAYKGRNKVYVHSVFSNFTFRILSLLVDIKSGSIMATNVR